MVKEVDVKKVAKTEISEQVGKALQDLGFTVLDGENFGFTAGSLVIRTEKTDVQIKLITPKAGVERYAELVEEDEVEDPMEGTEIPADAEKESDPADPAE